MKNIIEEIRNNPETRTAEKLIAKEKGMGFNLLTFGADVLLKTYNELITALHGYNPEALKDPEILKQARVQGAELISMLNADMDKPFIVHKRQGRTTRLNVSIGSNIFGIEPGVVKPTRIWVVAEHLFQKTLTFNWKIFSANPKEGQAIMEHLQQLMYERLGNQGLIVIYRNMEELRYGGFASSPSHQKHEKLIMAEASAMRHHEKAIWIAQTMNHFMSHAKCTGADLWKARANLVSPIIAPLTVNGEEVFLKDILTVNDVEKAFHLDNARVFGGEKLVEDRQEDVSCVLGDGAAISIPQIPADASDDEIADLLNRQAQQKHQGQLRGYGIKAMHVNGVSAIETLCEKHDMTVKEFLNQQVPNDAGVSCRLGDYKLLMGIGCWKFDKFGYANFSEFVKAVEALTVEYPGLDKVYLLRQADEVEGEEKARHLTRTLIQQWMDIDMKSLLNITKRARKSLKSQKTFVGMMRSLSGAGKAEEERSDEERLFGSALYLGASPVIQQYQQVRWEKKQADAAGGHLRTSGSYPYIMQDPVALLEVWVLGMNPNAEDLGVLRGNEISADGLRDKQKVLCVRFPANYQTAKVMVSKPCAKAFASCGNVAILSVHSDILIRQDGDVDGDEMAIITNSTAIELTERMEEKYHPPVVVFAHGSKAQKMIFGDRKTYIHEAYTALWRAKRFDSVGKYANLAMKCSYLASIAEQDGNTVLRNQYLLWMSAASTGAIMAIDQVKGNQVDAKLVNWLDNTINRAVMNTMNQLMPFVQQYAKKGYSANGCLPEDDRSICDNLAGFILRDTGRFELDTQGVLWNSKAAERSLLNHQVRMTAVRDSVVCGSFLNQLADNWFNDKNANDQEVFELVRAGQPVPFGKLLTLLWRNACALSQRMDGETLNDKRREYYKVCRDMLFAQADSTEWTDPKGYVFSSEEKHVSVVNVAVATALELRHPNKLVPDESKGNFAMFILRVFAKDILANIKAQPAHAADFYLDGIDMGDLTIDEDAMDELDQAIVSIEDEEIASSAEDGLFQDDLDGVVFSDDNDDYSFIA